MDIIYAISWLKRNKNALLLFVLIPVLALSLLYIGVHEFNKYKERKYLKEKQKQELLFKTQMNTNKVNIDSLKTQLLKLNKEDEVQENNPIIDHNYKSLDRFNSKYADKKGQR